MEIKALTLQKYSNGKISPHSHLSQEGCTQHEKQQINNIERQDLTGQSISNGKTNPTIAHPIFDIALQTREHYFLMLAQIQSKHVCTLSNIW